MEHDVPACDVCGLVPIVPRLQGTTQLIVRSAAMQDMLKRAARFAASDAPVAVLGETGTGKEVIARIVHN
ncbi:MAG: sigma 54-interacting transcriptional regulator, partial [Kofleriaceae bacterium]|nr:sigma 54-interacting transcriptional regulator [Kofleriaceae bacterium]